MESVFCIKLKGMYVPQGPQWQTDPSLGTLKQAALWGSHCQHLRRERRSCIPGRCHLPAYLPACVPWPKGH